MQMDIQSYALTQTAVDRKTHEDCVVHTTHRYDVANDLR